jgi:large subunit ribosomal protein L5
MRLIKLGKITLNIGCGDDKAKMEKAVKLLKLLANKTPVLTRSKRRSTFGVPKGKPIGVMVTLRGSSALDFLKKSFGGVDNKLTMRQFDAEGNFSFGIKEYIDIPSVKYSYDVGMMGFEITATLERPGFRIKKRRIQKGKIPAKHKISKEESIEWVKKTFGVQVV